MFNYSGGMGARATKPGPSATCYPTGVAAVPIEILEAVMPIIFDRKELRPGSGGRRRIARRRRPDHPVPHADEGSLAAQCGAEPCSSEGPEGLAGGEPGAAGRFLVNGRPVREAKKLALAPDDVVLLETPGGGGYGPPRRRYRATDRKRRSDNERKSKRWSN